MNKIHSKLLVLLLFLLAISGNRAMATGDCPKVVFDSRLNPGCYNDTIVDVYLAVCADSIDETWELDSVVWEMESSIYVTTQSLSISYNFSTPGMYVISAIAYFTVDNMPCSTAVERASDPEDLCYSPAYLSTLTINILTIEASVYTSPTVPVPYSNDNVDIILSYSAPGVVSSDILYQWFVDGVAGNSLTSSPGASPLTLTTDTFSPGQHVAEVKIEHSKMRECPVIVSTVFEILDSTLIPPCEECFTLRPIPGKRYWVSAWVKEDHPSAVKRYEQAEILLHFNGVSVPNVILKPTGAIIDGWQRVAGEFTVPLNTTSVDIQLVSADSVDTYFDDIRIHPFNASMKSYVYDPETFWLVAELDDNNYATFYEYDKEGQLVRIKKETARGVMTISETRSSNPKN